MEHIEALRSMIQLREPPFDVDVISTFDAMDGVLAIDDQTTLWKTARLMKRAGVKKRSDGQWNLLSIRQRVLREWDAPVKDGRRAGREAVHPFTVMEPGDSVSFANEDFHGRAYRAAMVHGHRTGKKFSGKLWTKANGERGITISRVDDDSVPVIRKNQDVEVVQSLVDWKAGIFVHDIVTASEVTKTLENIIDGISPVKAGLLLRKVPGTKRVRAYDGKGQVVVWIIRNLSKYEKIRGGEIWRIYRNERKLYTRIA